MSYDHHDPRNQLRAGWLMNELKGRIFDVSDVRVEGAGHAAASESHWRLSNASGVNVYQADGGWRTDLMFAGLPEGVPDVLGTPPMATRAKALEGIVATMSVCAQRDRLPRPEAVEGLLWFRFDEHMVPVDSGMLEHLVSRVPVAAFDTDHIQKELDLHRADISGDAPSRPHPGRRRSLSCATTPAACAAPPWPSASVVALPFDLGLF